MSGICSAVSYFYVEGYESAGPLGTYPTVVEWISKEEYDYLKKQGY